MPLDIDFGGVTQVFNVGGASCGVPGVPSGLAEAARRFGSMPLADLVRPGVELARAGLELNLQQAHLLKILAPMLEREPEGAAIYAPDGATLTAGERIAFPELADTLERFGRDGPEAFYRGDVADALVTRVQEAGGSLSMEDLAAYETIGREPLRRHLQGARDPDQPAALVGRHPDRLRPAADRTPRRRDRGARRGHGGGAEGPYPRVPAGLYEEGFADRFLTPAAVAASEDRCRALARGEGGGHGEGPLGSTTHITAVDGEGGCASVTCSNGSGSGLFASGTGIQINNMLGEADLNPFGFHATAPGARLPSMMAPTVVLGEHGLELGLGSGGSNRIRSAITQTIVRLLAEGVDVAAAVEAPRLHYEDGIVHAEPGIDPGCARAARGSRLRGDPLAGARTCSSAARTPSDARLTARSAAGRSPPRRRRRGRLTRRALLSAVAGRSGRSRARSTWPARRSRASA